MAHYTLEPLRPFGAIVRGLRLGGARPSAEVVAALALDAALHGFLVFRNHSLPGAELRRASLHLGAIAVAHSCHAEAVHCDILRLSNRPEQGIRGVGPQWHHDGAFERRVFSAVLFHAQQMPAAGGGTQLADAAAAFRALPRRRQRRWRRLASVNAYSGAVHPLVVRHPLTKRSGLFLHLGQTGAVVQWPRGGAASAECAAGATSVEPDAEAGRALEAMDARYGPAAARGHRLLTAVELTALLREADAALSMRAPVEDRPPCHRQGAPTPTHPGGGRRAGHRGTAPRNGPRRARCPRSACRRSPPPPHPS